MIRRPPRSTLSSSSAASDVYKRQSLHEFSRSGHKNRSHRLVHSHVEAKLEGGSWTQVAAFRPIARVVWRRNLPTHFRRAGAPPPRAWACRSPDRLRCLNGVAGRFVARSVQETPSISLQHDFVRVDVSDFCVQISRTRAEMINGPRRSRIGPKSVSYTHLTLPTKRIV